MRIAFPLHTMCLHDSFQQKKSAQLPAHGYKNNHEGIAHRLDLRILV
jgi:hypothetical protein